MLEAYRTYKHHHLEDPVVTAGDRLYILGTQDGLFPDMGRALPGEMGGLWANDLKLADGFFLALDDVPLTRCDAFSAHPLGNTFHYRLTEQGLHLVRSQFVPDGFSGCMVEVLLENLRPVPRTAELSFTLRTDLLPAQYPDDPDELGRDVGEYDPVLRAFVARNSRNPWHVAWGADAQMPVLLQDQPKEVYGFGNTQGKGMNGRMFYRIALPPSGQASVRLYIVGARAARSQVADALAQLRGQADALRTDKAARLSRLAAGAHARMPDAALTEAWNSARFGYDQLARRTPRNERALGTALPEQPGWFGGDLMQSLSGLLPLGGFEVFEETLTALRDASQAHRGDGSVVGALLSDGRTATPGGLAQTARFVCLAWRGYQWTAHEAFLRDLLPFLVQNMRWLAQRTGDFGEQPSALPEDADTCALLRAACDTFHRILRALRLPTEAAHAARMQRLSAPDDARPDSLAALACWHGERVHVEQMLGCVQQLAAAQQPRATVSSRLDAEGNCMSAQDLGAMLWPLARYLFGLVPDAPRRTLHWQPRTPIGWEGWSLREVRIGEAVFTLTSSRLTQGTAAYTIATTTPGWQVMVSAEGEERTHALEGTLQLVLPD